MRIGDVSLLVEIILTLIVVTPGPVQDPRRGKIGINGIQVGKGSFGRKIKAVYLAKDAIEILRVIRWQRWLLMTGEQTEDKQNDEGASHMALTMREPAKV